MGQGAERPAVKALLDGHWYDAVAVLLERSLPAEGAPAELLRAQHLATAARRVLDLDAEDFATIARRFRSPWASTLVDSSFPVQPRDPNRGALGSLVGLYELMLEVLEIRALRGEPLQVVVTAHLIGEYLVQLAWQTTLGHAGDPLQLQDFMAGSRWGTEDPLCPHSSALKSTARRALHACDGDIGAYTAYLDRFHSRQGAALAVCARSVATVAPGERPDIGDVCPNPCSFITRLPLEHRRDLDGRVRLALLYIDSPIVALRHHAPVGHFFGVPSVAEISAAWLRTWEKVTAAWPDGANPLSALGPFPTAEQPEALPGLSALVSAVAGQPIGPGRLVRDIGADVMASLSSAQQEATND